MGFLQTKQKRDETFLMDIFFETKCALILLRL